MPSHLETLTELQSVLRSLRESRHRLNNVPDDMKELHERYVALESQIAEQEEIAAEAEQERRAQEGAAGELQSKIDHYKEQINQVTTQREYGALLSEIDAAKAKQGEAEELALGAIERQETATSAIEPLRQEYGEIEAQVKEGLAAWEASKPEIAAEVDRLEAREEVLSGTLPPAVLSMFKRLYERHDGEPLARIDEIERPSGPKLYRCAVCSYQVRPQVVVEIRVNGEIKTCECGRQRIFYIEDAT